MTRAWSADDMMTSSGTCHEHVLMTLAGACRARVSHVPGTETARMSHVPGTEAARASHAPGGDRINHISKSQPPSMKL